jgi:HEAT repeat protein
MLSRPDPRVRLEALKVLLQHPATRQRAVTEAMESGEPPLVRTAMASLGGECPPELVAPILSVLSDEDDDMVMHAIRLIGESSNPLVVNPLLDLVRERRGLFRRWRLAPVSPIMLSALSALARRWANHRPVLPILQLAARSGDEDVLRAIGVIR